MFSEPKQQAVQAEAVGLHRAAVQVHMVFTLKKFSGASHKHIIHSTVSQTSPQSPRCIRTKMNAGWTGGSGMNDHRHVMQPTTTPTSYLKRDFKITGTVDGFNVLLLGYKGFILKFIHNNIRL